MNAAVAKQIPLVDFLIKTSATPKHTRGNEVWFLSPLREDGNEASFKVDTSKNVWFDHGSGCGGTIIDLIMHLENILDVTQALKRINEIWNNNVALSPVQKEYLLKVKEQSRNTTKEITIKKVVPLKNEALLNYLDSRKISFSLAEKYLQEIYYSIKEDQKINNYFGIAFENRSGGFEVRNAYAKTCLGEKDITIIKGKDSSKVSLFEGGLSFISMLQILNLSELKGDVIVMNSINMKQRTVEYIENKSYKTVYAFLDNDIHGHETTQYLFENLKNEFFDSRKLFAGFKDPNDLLNNKPIEPKA